MSEYPIKVKWHNDSKALNRFATRELEPLKGTPRNQRDITDKELKTIANAVMGRQKTNIVIKNKTEKELVVNQLERFVNGIAHPSYGAMWANKKISKSVNRKIKRIENYE